MKKIRFMLSVFFLCLGLSAFAQNKTTIRGTVLDKDNVAIVGANVAVKGTSNGTITDANGGFSINVTSTSSVLNVSCMGYIAVDVPVSTIKGALKVVLQESSVSLGEVVAIGYGSVRKKDATGALTAIKADEINRGLAVSPSDLLKGKVAGVAVTVDGGAPGAAATIRIRGGSSMDGSTSNDPLIVIDGVPVSNGSIWGASNPLSTINPNDIETFTILRDASSTAIYGSRASNGVILVTTKKGANGIGTSAPKLTYNGNFSIGTIAKKIQTMTADEFTTLVNDKYGVGSDEASWLGTAKTDWQNEIFRTALSTDHNLSVTGTVNSIPYRASANFISENGILLKSNMSRGTFAVGISPTFMDKRLKVNANLKGMVVKNRFSDQGAIGAALEMNPTVPVMQAGTYGNGYFISLKTDGMPNTIAIANPVSILNEKEDLSTVYRSIGNAQFDYTFKFLPELRANLNLGYDMTKSDGQVKIADNSVQSFVWGDLKNGKGERNPYGQNTRNLVLDYYMNYVKDLSGINSKIDVMGGYSYQHFFNDSFNEYFLLDGTARKIKTVGASESVLISLFGRVNYTFNERYLLTMTLRDDASSKFAPGNKHGIFPSLALAWRINEEAFMSDFSNLSDLKLRVGYGVTGQQDVLGNDYPYLARYEYGTSGAYMMFGNQSIRLIRPMGYDSKIKWESTSTYNVGLDYGFFNGRLAGSFDLYKRMTFDLINTIPVPAGTNFRNEIATNVGDLVNQGVEFSINTKPIVGKDLNWDLGFNLAYNKNEITRLTRYADASYVGVPKGGVAGGTGNNIQMNSVGFPVNSFYVYQQVYDANGNPLEGQYVDRSRDGKITEADLYHSGQAAPVMIMGLSSKLMYKEWDFSLTARCNVGNSVYNNVRSTRENLSDSYYSGFLKNRLQSALKTNFNNAQYLSDYYIEDGSFFRLDNVTIGYTLDKPFGTNANARVFGTVQNALLLTKYSGLDPEMYSGIDNNVYPRPRTVIVGVSINF